MLYKGIGASFEFEVLPMVFGKPVSFLLSLFPIKFDDLVLLPITRKQAEVNICDSLGYFFKGAIHKFCHNPHAHNDFKLSSIL